MTKTPSQPLLKLSTSWWNNGAKMFCQACIDIQSQWMCLMMLTVIYYNSKFGCIDSKVQLTTDKNPTTKEFKATVTRAMHYLFRNCL